MLTCRHVEAPCISFPLSLLYWSVYQFRLLRCITPFYFRHTQWTQFSQAVYVPDRSSLHQPYNSSAGRICQLPADLLLGLFEELSHVPEEIHKNDHDDEGIWTTHGETHTSSEIVQTTVYKSGQWLNQAFCGYYGCEMEELRKARWKRCTFWGNYATYNTPNNYASTASQFTHYLRSIVKWAIIRIPAHLQSFITMSNFISLSPNLFVFPPPNFTWTIES